MRIIGWLVHKTGSRLMLSEWLPVACAQLAAYAANRVCSSRAQRQHARSVACSRGDSLDPGWWVLRRVRAELPRTRVWDNDARPRARPSLGATGHPGLFLQQLHIFFIFLFLCILLQSFYYFIKYLTHKNILFHYFIFILHFAII